MMHLSCTIAGATHIIRVKIANSIETCLSMDIVISGGKVKENISYLQILDYLNVKNVKMKFAGGFPCSHVSSFVNLTGKSYLC